jgi:hypothetical protein
MYLQRDVGGLSLSMTDGLFYSYDSAVEAVKQYYHDVARDLPDWVNGGAVESGDKTVKLVSSQVMEF